MLLWFDMYDIQWVGSSGCVVAYKMSYGSGFLLIITYSVCHQDVDAKYAVVTLVRPLATWNAFFDVFHAKC